MAELLGGPLDGDRIELPTRRGLLVPEPGALARARWIVCPHCGSLNCQIERDGMYIVREDGSVVWRQTPLREMNADAN